uniref:Uncharacterized protein n=1 Tax=Cacopsylla melanoneura TaxID=428564 RepID=A0A8D8Z6W8_9HEMI
MVCTMPGGANKFPVTELDNIVEFANDVTKKHGPKTQQKDIKETIKIVINTYSNILKTVFLEIGGQIGNSQTSVYNTGALLDNVERLRAEVMNVNDKYPNIGISFDFVYNEYFAHFSHKINAENGRVEKIPTGDDTWVDNTDTTNMVVANGKKTPKRKQETNSNQIQSKPKRPTTRKDLGKLLECMHKDNEAEEEGRVGGASYEKIVAACFSSSPVDQSADSFALQVDFNMLEHINKYLRAHTADMPLTNPVTNYADIYRYVQSVYVHDSSLWDFRAHLTVMIQRSATAEGGGEVAFNINREFNEMKSWLSVKDDFSNSVSGVKKMTGNELFYAFGRHFAHMDVIDEICRIYKQTAAYISNLENTSPSGEQKNLNQLKNAYLGREPPSTTQLRILIFNMWSSFGVVKLRSGVG